jgi:UDP-glucose 4-epimerase
MKILVTGGLGFIGSHTVLSLVEAGYEPLIMDNLSNSELFILERLKQITNKNIAFYQADCLDKKALHQIFSENEIKGIIHFAAYKAVGESVSEPLKYYENNLVSLIYLLQTMQAHRVQHLVFSSSCTVYGQAEQLPVRESAQILPAFSPYGNTKQIGEEIIKDATMASEYLKAISLRYFNPIGSHPSALIGELPKGVPNNLVPFITQTAIGLRKELQIFGNDYPTPDGTCIRDYIHVCDLAEAHVKALDYLQNKQEKYYDFINIGTGKGVSVLEMVQTFEKVTQTPLAYKIAPRREGDVTAIYADAQKAWEVLGWKAQRNVEQALLDAWNWQKTLCNDFGDRNFL